MLRERTPSIVAASDRYSTGMCSRAPTSAVTLSARVCMRSFDGEFDVLVARDVLTMFAAHHRSVVDLSEDVVNAARA